MAFALHYRSNPAVTIARSTTSTFSGIHPDGIYAFIVAQFAGAILATLFVRWLWPRHHGDH